MKCMREIVNWPNNGRKRQPMIAGDGMHYANGVKMPGPGKYHLTYTLSAPAIYRHADKETGVPEWWKPFSADWDFTYPSKAK